jgi:sugar phosphate permease
LINGCGSIGAIIGGTLPGWIGFWVDDGVSIWGYVFNGLAVSLIIGACLLVPQWNALPATASKPKKNELP